MDNFFLKYIAVKPHRPKALLFGFFLSILGFALIDGTLEKGLPNASARFTIYGLVLFVGLSYWLYYRFHLPRNKKDRVGLVVAIYAESTHEEKRLKTDLISQLQKSISAHGFSNTLNLVVVKNHISEQLKDIDDLLRIHKTIKGHFYLYGRVKRRNDEQKSYFLDLDGMVTHRPVDVLLKNQLLRDFVTVLPKQISFYEAFEFRGFQFTANIVYLAVRYITGTAAYLSGDPVLAYRFHHNLRDEFNRFRPLPPQLQKIWERIPLLLSNEALTIARHHHQKNELPQMERWITKSLNTNPNNYGAWLFKAIKEFLVDDNPQGALQSIKKAKRYATATSEWRYSLAFLQFWLENYPDALNTCDKIASSSYPGEQLTIAEVEEFNLQLLQNKETIKPQLYFWLGFLNYKKKVNLPQALKYLEEFEKHATPPMLILKQRSTPYLDKIKKSMKIQ